MFGINIWKQVGLTTFLVILLTAMIIVIEGLSDDIQTSDVAVILGSKVELNGQPSARLIARLDKAQALYTAKVVKNFIVSGGTGKEGFDEATVMHDYLVRAGIPAAAIIVDSNGDNTQDTARNCASLMKAHGFKSVIIVTQYFHISRTRLALHAYGINEVHSAHAQFFELRDIYSIAREVVALPTYWFIIHYRI